MTLEQYQIDSYMKEFDTKIRSIEDGRFIILEDTVFYPNSGGQPHDTGKLIAEDGTEYPVVYVGKFNESISHEINPDGLPVLREGQSIRCVIDWERRYTHMKMHTAAHLLSRVIYQEAGAHTSGNQLGEDKSRIDFTLDNMDKEKIQGWFDKANEIIKKGLPVIIRTITREEAEEKLEGPSKHLMADLDELRLIRIEGLDEQTCGGTHLKNIGEIGKLKLVNLKNKGKNNRRLYYSIE